MCLITFVKLLYSAEPVITFMLRLFKRFAHRLIIRNMVRIEKDDFFYFVFCTVTTSLVVSSRCNLLLQLQIAPSIKIAPSLAS